MARCQTCGAVLSDPIERFCGGDRCLHVLMPPRGHSEPVP
jgi:hypothetical protein